MSQQPLQKKQPKKAMSGHFVSVSLEPAINTLLDEMLAENALYTRSALIRGAILLLHRQRVDARGDLVQEAATMKRKEKA